MDVSALRGRLEARLKRIGDAIGRMEIAIETSRGFGYRLTPKGA